MTNDFNQNIVAAIRALYKEDEHAQALFDWMAQRSRDASSTSIDRISQKLDISRGEAVALARRLEEAECGEFKVGRRGQPSRFTWDYSCISLGQAAAGELAELQAVRDAIPEAEEEDEEEAEESRASAPYKLTISEAKAALANALGVSVSNIEIIVKA